LLLELAALLGEGFELSITAGLKKLPLGDVPPNVIPLGRLESEEQLRRAYQECDAVICPTQFEGFGYVPLEAMACGKPVIASRNSAIPEVVEDGVTGYLCSTNDVNDFAAKCRLLANQMQRRERMGKAGRNRAVAHFSEDVVVPQYLALYESLL
jgi:starch synthase